MKRFGAALFTVCLASLPTIAAEPTLPAEEGGHETASSPRRSASTIGVSPWALFQGVLTIERRHGRRTYRIWRWVPDPGELQITDQPDPIETEAPGTRKTEDDPSLDKFDGS